MEKFIIKLKRTGLYQFKLIADNGEAVLNSLSYTSKQACIDDVEILKRKKDIKQNMLLTELDNGHCFFTLFKSGIDMLAISKEFETEIDCLIAIHFLQQQLPYVETDEQIR